MVLKDGIGRGLEEQFLTDPVAARQYLENPGKILALENPLIARLIECVSPILGCYDFFGWAGCIQP